MGWDGMAAPVEGKGTGDPSALRRCWLPASSGTERLVDCSAAAEEDFF